MDVLSPVEKQEFAQANREIDERVGPLKARLGELTVVADSILKAKGANPKPPEALKNSLSDAQRKEYILLTDRIGTIEATRPTAPKAMAVTDRANAFAPSHLLIRGDPAHPGQEVQPGFICSLPGGDANIGPERALATTTGRRLALSNWLTHDNPLFARAWVNRVWKQHFGHGIVDTPSNLGVSGQLPSHPELLDWLATTFEKSGWSTKALHRQIMLSETYQQGSAIRPDLMQKDPLDRLLWRYPVRRVEGEVVRDSILSACGTLNVTIGGPPVYPPVDLSLRADTFQGPNWQDGVDGPSTWRRSVYVKVKRSLLLPELEVFDCPEITNSVAARNITTTPTQALTLMNGLFVSHQAELFAQRLVREAGKDPLAQIRRAYRIAFQRYPSPEELAAGIRFLNKERTERLTESAALSGLCHALLNFNEFVYVD